MRSLSRSLAAAGIALLGWAGTAEAAPVTANFIGSTGVIFPGVGLDLDLGGGLSVRVTAHTHSDGAGAPFDSVVETNLHRDGEGVGVQDNNADSPDLDGSGTRDMLRFTFNKSVTLLSVLFENAGNNDEFDMSVDDVDLNISALLGNDDIDDLLEGGFGDDSNLADFTGDGLIGTVFDFYTDDVGDSYRIRAMTVEAGDGGGGGDVPAPPVLPLLGIDLAGLGLALGKKGWQK